MPDRQEQNACMDFAMRYDRWYRIWASIAGLGQSRTIIRVDDDQLRVTHGWAFHVDIPLAKIRSAKPISERPLAAKSEVSTSVSKTRTASSQR